MHASQILSAVEAWATGCYLVREIGLIENGRLDGVLVPLGPKAFPLNRRGNWWDRHCLVGVEAKATRSDFLRGLKEGQFERYLASGVIGGLIIAAWENVVKRGEIPDGIGHVVVGYRPNGVKLVASCRRLPALKDAPLSQETSWRLLQRMHDEFRKREHEADIAYKRKLKRIGKMAARRFFSVIGQPVPNEFY